MLAAGDAHNVPAEESNDAGTLEELRQVCAAWEAAFGQSRDAILVFNAHNRVVRANSAFAQLVDLPMTDILGKTCCELFRATRIAPDEQLMQQSKQSRKPAESETFCPGSGVWLQMSVKPMIDERGEWIGTVHRIVDITDRKRAEEEVRQSEERYRRLFQQASEPIVLVDPQSGEFVDFNNRAHEMLGYAREELTALRVMDIDASPAEQTRRSIERLLAEGSGIFETCVRTKNGDVRDIRATSQMILLHGRKLIQTTWKDVTERKRYDSAVHLLSTTDELTELYNRRGFLTVAEHQIKVARRAGRELALLLLDVDSIKAVNDRHGHREGDRLLRDLSRLLRSAFRESDILARIGGDEFAVMVVEPDRMSAEAYAERTRRRVAQRNTQSAAPPIVLNIGTTHYDGKTAKSLEELLNEADGRMHEDKLRRASKPNVEAGEP